MENINFLKNHVMSLIEYEPELEWFLFGEETIIFKELTDNNRCRKLTYFKRKHDPISDVVYGYFKCEILGNRKFYFESKNSKVLKIIELDDDIK